MAANDSYGDHSYGAAFARDGRLATTSLDGKIRLYAYDPDSKTPNFRVVGQPTPAPSGRRPRGQQPVGLVFAVDAEDDFGGLRGLPNVGFV